MSDTVYPYRINYPRTGDWYDNGGTWYQLSTWCNTCIEKGEWDYYYGVFVFAREQDYMLFKLKWL